jgi:pimeloyl-ACP methyl ester carboxylesterase
MKQIRNIQISGKHKKDILTDVFFLENEKQKDVVVFCHGYKGYKDWGAWDLVAEQFAQEGYFFVKMNFSHNGGTPEQPIDFPDLEAFGMNNFIKELDDLQTVIDWLSVGNAFEKEMNLNQVTLVGHSRGGGIVLLKAHEDDRVKKVVTWAGVSDYASRFPEGEVLEHWKNTGVAYVHNGRTKQEMPHYYQFYTTFKENEERLTIKNAVSNLKIPILIVHGDEDETVGIQEARNLHDWNEGSQLRIVKGANHTFGSSQPWGEKQLPDHLQIAIQATLDFL